jgi:hypothetical protein
MGIVDAPVDTIYLEGSGPKQAAEDYGFNL